MDKVTETHHPEIRKYIRKEIKEHDSHSLKPKMSVSPDSDLNEIMRN